MASARREGLGSALRAARTRPNTSPSPSPTGSQSTPATAAPGRRRIVGTSTLRSKPTSTVEALAAFNYFNDPGDLQTTPVEEGREEECIDQLAYAFQYGSDLLTFLKSTGLKIPTDYTSDNTTADVDFHSLLSGLAHVMHPVFYHEAAKLLDLEHDHEFCHLRAVVLTETEDTAPQLALIRRLGDRHQKIKPAYTDSDRVSDLWHVLAESAKKSPSVRVPAVPCGVARAAGGAQLYIFPPRTPYPPCNSGRESPGHTLARRHSHH
ncbi:hypothetical protein CYMTET_16856 [Cymbomonas tetramitiformis]|uniref:Uncharacterized protein n=1 Tax=Cymbomonas tetramitiformis TaxID=36881 RepID=A0AAE0GBI9_9CHLO|nr:hypothetical protein CYMTET_16856 [Cymbomonas tetramitiformis]